MLSKLQKIVLRHSLKLARKLKVKDHQLYLQTIPSAKEFQMHDHLFDFDRDKQTIEALIPEELHSLMATCSNRFLDGDILHNLICTAYKNPKLDNESSTVATKDDLALEMLRVLSAQVQTFDAISLIFINISKRI